MAKYFKKKDVDNTVRSVMDDGKSVCYGCLGTVADLKSVGILECCDAPDDSWCFIASDRKKAATADLTTSETLSSP